MLFEVEVEVDTLDFHTDVSNNTGLASAAFCMYPSSKLALHPFFSELRVVEFAATSSSWLLRPSIRPCYLSPLPPVFAFVRVAQVIQIVAAKLYHHLLFCSSTIYSSANPP